MRLTKKDNSEINLSTGEADPEFAEWKWAKPEEVIEQVQQKQISFQIIYFSTISVYHCLRFARYLNTGSGLQEANV